jgi:toxin-antitoxin system PIN domain toxin
VIVLDANVLLYAYNPSSAHHGACRAWLEQALNGTEQVGLPWQTVLAFVRIATNSRVFEPPLAAAEAAAIVDEWLACPRVLIVHPGHDYWTILKEQLDSAQVAGPLVTDAALASLAIEVGARLCTTDRDFARFRGLRIVDPRE